MSEVQVLAAAAAIGEFDARILSAYCPDDPAEVQVVLDRNAILFAAETAAGRSTRWRVIDVDALRERIVALEQQDATTRQLPPLMAPPCDPLRDPRLRVATTALADGARIRTVAGRRMQSAAAIHLARSLQREHEPRREDPRGAADEIVSDLTSLVIALATIFAAEGLRGRGRTLRDLVVQIEALRGRVDEGRRAELIEAIRTIAPRAMRDASASDQHAPSMLRRLLGGSGVTPRHGS